MNETQTIDLEKGLLCTLILGGSEAVAEVAGILKANDFLRVEHQLIYTAIIRLFDANKPIDVRTLKRKLYVLYALDDEIAQYVFALTQIEYPSITKARYYAEEVLEASRKRRLAELGRILTEGKGGSRELIARLEGEMAVLHGAESRMESALEIALRTMENLTKSERGLKTGLIDLDKVTGGLKKSDLIILAARPSMGKTALGMNIAAEVSKTATVGVFSLEMSKEQLMRRLMSSESGVLATRLGQELNELERRKLESAASGISKRQLYIDDTGAISLLEMKSRARRLKREHGLELIVVDYLQLMQSSGAYRGNRVQEVSEISRGLKALAKEIDVPILALSQLSRAVEQRAEKKPVLSDLRESGSIEQDADIVLFLYREEYYNREEESNIAEVLVAKNRNGATGSVRLYFDKPTVTFRNLTREVR